MHRNNRLKRQASGSLVNDQVGSDDESASASVSADGSSDDIFNEIIAIQGIKKKEEKKVETQKF